MSSASIRSTPTTELEKSSIAFVGSLAILWLLIPYLIFSIKCYELYLTVPTILVVGYFTTPTFKNLFGKRHTVSIPFSCVIPALMVAILFTWLSGLFPPLGMARDFDKHFAIMNLLADSDAWPPTFNHPDGEYFLRYDIALYEVPALLQKVVPLGTRYWLALYEIIGLTLIFICLSYAVLTPSKNVFLNFFKNFTLFCIFMGFSGLDIIGSIYTAAPIDIGRHLEWWAGSFSFSSMTTQFDWAPQHCMPAWLGAILLYLNAREKGMILQQSMLLLLFLVFFWSPLVLLGILFLLPLYARESFYLLKNRKNIIMSFLMFLVVLVPIIIYFKAGTVDIPKKLIWNPFQPTMEAFKLVMTFLTLEAYIYIVLLLIISKKLFDKILLINTTIVFMICTIFHFGFLNDFALKVSLPSLTLLAMLVAGTFMASDYLSFPRKVLRIVLLLTYVIGLFTPAYEVVRSYKEMNFNLSASNMKDHEKEWWWIQYVSPMEDKPFFIKIQPDPISFHFNN